MKENEVYYLSFIDTEYIIRVKSIKNEYVMLEWYSSTSGYSSSKRHIPESDIRDRNRYIPAEIDEWSLAVMKGRYDGRAETR